MAPQQKPPAGEIGTVGQITGVLSRVGGMLIQENEQANDLRWPQSAEQYERMLFTDSQVRSLYLGTTLPLQNYHWGVDPNGADPDMTAELAADMGLPVGLPDDPEEEQQLAPGRYRFNFLEHLSEACLAVPFGFYPFEQVVELGEDGLMHLRKLGPRAPATLAADGIVVAPDGGLVGIRQKIGLPLLNAGNLVGMPPPLIPVEKLLYYVWQPDARAKWLGRPMLRAMNFHWTIKDMLIRVDAINHEKAGGVPVVETDETYAGSNLDDLQALTQNWRVGEDSGAVFPPGAKLALKALGGSDVIASIDYHDSQMAKVWQAMLQEVARAATGNRALGDTYAGVQDKTQRAIAAWFRGTFREHMIEDWWRWNVGEAPDGSPLPHPRLVCRAPTDPVPMSQPSQGGTAPPDPPRAAAGLPSPQASTGPSAEETRAVGSLSGGSTAFRGPRPPLPALPANGSESVVSTAAPPTRAVGTGVGSTGQAADGRPSFRRDPYPHELAAKTDFAGLHDLHDTGENDALALLNDEWLPALTQQVADKIAALGDAPSPAALAAITLNPPDAGPLHDILLATAKKAADDAGAELAAQSVSVAEADAAALEALIRGQAEAMAAQIASGVSLAATRKAVQLTTPGITADDLAAGVTSYLGGLVHAWERDQVVGAVSQAMNSGRFARFGLIQQTATYYASELLDDATCDACAEVDGTTYATLDEAMAEYSGGGYNDCAGGPRCRGTIIATAGTEI